MSPSKLVARCAAFGCGGVLALAILGPRQQVDAASAARTIHTCAAADGTLRLSDPAIPCQPDERRVRVQIPAQPDPECKQDDARLEKLKQRVNDLETRDRQGTLRGRRVRAPFEVVTKKGRRVFRIEDHNVMLYTLEGKPVVWIVADNSGGMLHTQSVGGDREAMITAQGSVARILIKEKGHDRIDLGRRKNGRYGLQVFGASNKLVGYLGQSEVGSGLLLIADANGTEKAAMFVRNQDSAGRVHVTNAAGAIVGIMQASGSENQSPFQLSDAAGTAMVEAGLIKTGAGVVRAGPEFRNFGVGLLGIVPSMIMGKP